MHQIPREAMKLPEALLCHQMSPLNLRECAQAMETGKCDFDTLSCHLTTLRFCTKKILKMMLVHHLACVLSGDHCTS